MRHQLECSYNCGWCSKPICEECVAAAGGKKYCDKCWAKKQQMSGPSKNEDMPKASTTRTPIRNVDTTLDPKIAEQRRATADQAKKKIFEL
jgi:hypothetical protein